MYRFAWNENVSTNTTAAHDFYTQLFGWTATSNPIQSPMGEWPYWTFHRNEVDAGGLMPVMQPDMPSAWFSTIFVPDIEAAVKQVRDSGGTVFNDPVDIPDQGKFSWILDPQGACLVLGERASQVDPTTGKGQLSVAAWHELKTTDVAGASTFYGDLLGWTSEDVDMGTGPYTVFNRDGAPVAGALIKPDEVPAPVWIIYFSVADVDVALARVRELGGQKLFEIIELPTIGRFGWASDPAGGLFALMQEVSPS